MKHKMYFFALLAIMLVACGCENKKPDEPQPDLSLLKREVLVTNDWVWSGKPEITVRVENQNAVAAKVPTKLTILTDKKVAVTTVFDTIEIAGNATRDFVYTTTETLDPGFYRAKYYFNDKLARDFYFGIDPFQIVSAPDMQPDFDAFWQTAKDQLAAVEMNAVLKEIEDYSSAKRKVYLVEMNSVPDGLSGEPVKIRGYYCEPKDGQKHPVILHFYGYDTQGSKARCECPSGGSSTNAEFYLSHRGQYLNNRPAETNPGVDEATENIYGDWFAYHLGDKDSYYYRGAYMDVVQAVRFMATRETSDMTKLFAEGSSQGGALTYACAALSDYPFSAIAANVAFMGDFADAIEIPSLAYWEINDNRGSMTDEDILKSMSYFDIKNLTPRISCAVLGSSGLQDDVCPPRLNVVPFNNLATPADKKEYLFGPEMGHSYPSNWWSRMNALFEKYY